MDLLVLGGSIFLGRHVVDAALSRGHRVTVFNRGLHESDLPRDVERITGDRYGDLAPLRSRRWDAVVDTCGFVPNAVGATAELLGAAVDRYVFISSGSVYCDLSVPGVDETGAVGSITREERAAAEDAKPSTGSTDPAFMKAYGPLKALCERAAEERLPGRVLNVRAGLIVGPRDPSDRFTYWVARIARGGDVLAPGRPERSVQIIDVRDLAGWIVRMVEGRGSGTYNATGPGDGLSMLQLLESCRRVSGSDARLVWVDEEFLLDSGVAPWSELPLWIPEKEDAMRFMFSIDCSRAIASGLSFRSLDETIRDTLGWDEGRPPETQRRAGMSPDREAQLLGEWRGRADARR